MLVVSDVESLCRGAVASAVNRVGCGNPCLFIGIRGEGDGGRRSAIFCTIEGNEICIVCYRFRSIVSIVHQMTTNDNLVAHLNISLTGLVFLFVEVEHAVAEELIILCTVIGNVE